MTNIPFNIFKVFIDKFFLNITIICLIIITVHTFNFWSMDLYIWKISYLGIFCFFLWTATIIGKIKTSNKYVWGLVLESILFSLLLLTSVFLYLNFTLSNETLSTLPIQPDKAQKILYLLLITSAGTIWNLSNLRKQNLAPSKSLKEKTGFAAIIIILIIYTLFKLPYFGVSFTGLHTMKYNSYVEPAKYMVAQGDFSWYQKKYGADPINSPEGILDHFGHFPIIEWLLALSYTLFPNLSIEVNTRIVMHLIGALMIIFSHYTFSKWLDRSSALIATFLIASIPVILFSTFVTVQDSLSLVFMFLGLIYLDKYFTKNIGGYLCTSAIMLGLGIAIKYNTAIFAYVIYFFLLFFKRKSTAEAIRDSLALLLFSTAPFFISKIAIEPMPEKGFFYSTVLLLLLSILIYLIYRIYICFQEKITFQIQSIITDSRTIYFLLIPPILAIFAMLSLIDIKFLASESLTDYRLLFNSDLYSYMLFNQFAQYLTPPLFYLSLTALPYLFFIKKVTKQYIFAFIVGSIIYWILASKVMFFHNYYTLIVLITFAMILSVLPQIFTKNYYKFGIIIIIILFALSAQTETSRLLSLERRGFEEAALYLLNNTSSDEIYADESFVLSLTISTDRARLGQISSINTPEIRKRIKDEGFASTMNALGIKYLITEAAAPDYQRWSVLFSDDISDDSDYRRTDRIYERLYPEYEYYPDSKVRIQAVAEYDIMNKFHLETIVGGYKFYTFRN